jgi:hypothetical protein
MEWGSKDNRQQQNFDLLAGTTKNVFDNQILFTTTTRHSTKKGL